MGVRRTSSKPVVVVGAGVTGLTAAYRLTQLGQNVVVVEAQERPGGNIETARHDGFVYDLGPDSFLKTKPAGAALCRELGLQDQVIQPQEGAQLVHVAREGSLHPMPEGLSLGVPKRPGPLLATPLLSGEAKFRAMLEPFVRRPKEVGEETIHGFLARRLGHEMAERLAAPLLSGVFAGDAHKLSMDAAFPMLIALEKKHGSLFRGMNGGKSILKVLLEETPPPESPFMSLRGGLSDLVDALVARLPEGSLRLSSPVQGLTLSGDDGSDVQVHLPGETVEACHVICAGPPWSARKILGPLDAQLDDALDQVRGFPTATVFFGLDARHAESDFDGSGFICPPGEADILASTFISSKWSHRAPDGSVLVRAFVGGSRKDIRGYSEDDLRSIAHRELTRFLGNLGPVTFSRVHHYDRGTPQPELGYRELLQRISQRVAQCPSVSLIGSGYGGAGIPDCIRQANELVEQDWGVADSATKGESHAPVSGAAVSSAQSTDQEAASVSAGSRSH